VKSGHSLRPLGRQDPGSSSRAVREQQLDASRVLREGTTLGFVTLLHLWLIVYLTIPALPADKETTAFSESDALALKVQFISNAASHRAVSHTSTAPPTTHPLPGSKSRREKKRTTEASAQIGTPTKPSIASNEAPPSEVGAQTPPDNGPPVSYGNPLLRAGQDGGATGHLRIPGSADGALVDTIALKEPPSVKQEIKITGKFMNCSQVRIARFLSASEMDRRHITTQELDQAFTEYGCK
jgi:hypothetical protein